MTVDRGRRGADRQEKDANPYENPRSSTPSLAPVSAASAFFATAAAAAAPAAAFAAAASTAGNGGLKKGSFAASRHCGWKKASPAAEKTREGW